MHRKRSALRDRVQHDAREHNPASSSFFLPPDVFAPLECPPLLPSSLLSTVSIPPSSERGVARRSSQAVRLSAGIKYSRWVGVARRSTEWRGVARRGVACSAVSVDARVFAVGRKETGEKEELKRFSPSSTSSSSLPRPFSLPLSLSPLSTPSLPPFLSVPLARTELSPARNRERRYPPRATAAPRGRLRASEG